MNHFEEHVANLLTNRGYCESCRRIPAEYRELINLEGDEKFKKFTHHATLSDLESAANKGCKICQFVRKKWLQMLERDECLKRRFSCHQTFSDFGLLDDETDANELRIDLYEDLKPIASKLHSFVMQMILRKTK